LFRKPEDYGAFERIMVLAHQRAPLPILDWCIMKNHWHFVVRPKTDDQITQFFRWLTHTHAMRWRVSRRTVGWGHLYQGRFKAFPIQSDGHLLTVLRYVERNALTAGAVKHAEDWRGGSLWVRREGPAELRRLLAPWPIDRPRDWLKIVNMPLSKKELEQVRLSVTRSRPYGDPAWTRETASALDLDHTLRSEGRPAKDKDAE
jgi:putative transposase